MAVTQDKPYINVVLSPHD